MIRMMKEKKENQHSKECSDQSGEVPRCRLSPVSQGLSGRLCNVTDREDKDGGQEEEGEDNPVGFGQFEVLVCNVDLS